MNKIRFFENLLGVSIKELEGKIIEEDNKKIFVISNGVEFIDDIKIYSNYKDICKCNKIIFPESCKIILDNAFEGFDNLIEIEFPEVTRYWTVINSYAFHNCKNLKYVKLPENLVEIREGAFKNCYSLEKVRLPFTLKKIDDCAFENCKNLVYFNIPDNVVCSGLSTFSGCSLMKLSIRLNLNNENSVLLNTFKDCQNLKRISVFCDKTINILKGSFENCNNLHYLKIPKNVKLICESAFYGTSDLDLYYEGTEEDFNKIIYQYQYDGDLEEKTMLEAKSLPFNLPFTVHYLNK